MLKPMTVTSTKSRSNACPHMAQVVTNTEERLEKHNKHLTAALTLTVVAMCAALSPAGDKLLDAEVRRHLNFAA